MSQKNIFAEIILILIGLFLIIEKYFIKIISFDYSKIGLSFLDPWFGHEIIGGILLLIGLILIARKW